MTEPLAFTIQQAALAAAASRTTLYAALKSGDLRAVKRGRRTLILQADLRSWLERHPALNLRPEARRTARQWNVEPGLVATGTTTPRYKLSSQTQIEMSDAFYSRMARGACGYA